MMILMMIMIIRRIAKLPLVLLLTLVLLPPRPDLAIPDQARPQKYFMLTLFWHEWASDRRCEALDSSNMKVFSSSIDLDRSGG